MKQLSQVFDEVAKHMDGDNINSVFDILREVNGWSMIQDSEVQEMIDNDMKLGYYPGCLDIA